MKINYKINKKQIVEKFKQYTKNNYDESSTYGLDNNNNNNLNKIKDIYLYIINNIKLDIRREFIHDDKAFKSVINLLMNRVNNKIRTNNDGQLYISVGDNDQIKFNGDYEQYKTQLISNLKNQERVIKKMVDELNSVLDGTIKNEEGKVIIKNRAIKEFKKPSDIINDFLNNINKDYVLEIFEGNFINFDKYYFSFMKENNIDIDISKSFLINIHEIFINSNKPSELYSKILREASLIREADDAPKQIYKRFDDPGLENRREKSMDQLRGRGLTPKGGGWHNKRGELVATIGEKGEIVWKSETTTNQNPTPYDQTKSYASNKEKINMQDQQPIETEIETGFSDDELETIRKTFSHNEVNHA